MTAELEWEIGEDAGVTLAFGGWGAEWGGEWGGSVDDVDPSDYAAALRQLLPPGEGWNLDPDGVLYKLMTGLSMELARTEDRVRELINEYDPRTTLELLGDWERIYGLPGQCSSPPTTLEGRRNALWAKMAAKDAGNIPFYLELAERLGFSGAEIHRMHDPFTAGSSAGDSLYGEAGGWNDVFLLLANDSNDNDGTLQCLINTYKQAHEIAIFEAPPGWTAPEV